MRDKFMQWMPPSSSSSTEEGAAASSPTESARSDPEQGRAQWFNYENFKEAMYGKLVHHRQTPPSAAAAHAQQQSEQPVASSKP